MADGWAAEGRTINNPEEYGAAIDRARQGQLLVVAVWSDASLQCKAAASQIQWMSKEYTDAEFWKMYLNGSTQPLIKFGVQNTPIFILAQGEWATTVLGANMKMLEDAIKQRTS